MSMSPIRLCSTLSFYSIYLWVLSLKIWFSYFVDWFFVWKKKCTTYGANPCKALAELAAAAVASGVGKRKAVADAPAGGNTAAVRAARPLWIATPRSADFVDFHFGLR